MPQVKAFGTEAATAPLQELKITRREVLANDVQIEILFCGICHSDLHSARNDWGGAKYPMVPGHEIVGRVTKIGDGVSKFKVGDLAGVGCIVDSCRECSHCHDGDEQYCENGNTIVFNSKDRKHGGITYGGFSETIVVDENYVVHVPDTLDLASAAPILCAGVLPTKTLESRSREKCWNYWHWRFGTHGNKNCQSNGCICFSVYYFASQSR